MNSSSSKKLTTLLSNYPDLLQACVESKAQDSPTERSKMHVSPAKHQLCKCESCKWTGLPYPWNPYYNQGPAQVSHIYDCVYHHQRALWEAWSRGVLSQQQWFEQSSYNQTEFGNFFKTVTENPMLYSPYLGVSNNKYPPGQSSAAQERPVPQAGNQLYIRGTSMPAHCYKNVNVPKTNVNGQYSQQSQIPCGCIPRLKAPQCSIPHKQSSRVCFCVAVSSTGVLQPKILPSDARFRHTSYHRIERPTQRDTHFDNTPSMAQNPVEAITVDSSPEMRPDSGLSNIDDDSLFKRPDSALSNMDNTIPENVKRPGSSMSQFSEQDSGIDELRSRSVTPPPDPLPPMAEEDETVGDIYSDADNSEDLDLETSELDFTNHPSDACDHDDHDRSGQRSVEINGMEYPGEGGEAMACPSLIDNIFPSHPLIIATDSEDSESDEEELVNNCPGSENKTQAGLPFGAYSASMANPGADYWNTNSHVQHVHNQKRFKPNEESNKQTVRSAPWQPWLTCDSHVEQQEHEEVPPQYEQPAPFSYYRPFVQCDTRRNTSTPLPWGSADGVSSSTDQLPSGSVFPQQDSTQGNHSIPEIQNRGVNNKRKRENDYM